MDEPIQILLPSKDLFGPLWTPHSGEQKGGSRNVMDFFDVRKLSANLVRESQGSAETKLREEDYSVVALFPIVMIGAVLFVICGAYRIKRWKLEKKQMAQLSLFYDVFEETKCDHNCLSYQGHEAGCNKLRSALMIPPARTSPFFQPPAGKNKKPRLEVPINASHADISYQLSKLFFNGDASSQIHIV